MNIKIGGDALISGIGPLKMLMLDDIVVENQCDEASSVAHVAFLLFVTFYNPRGL